MAAGIEGGSKRQIEAEWSLQDYAEQLRHWDKTAPPPYIGIMLAASALGVDFNKIREAARERSQPDTSGMSPVSGPTIAELAARIGPAPVDGGSTMAASREVLRALSERNGDER